MSVTAAVIAPPTPASSSHPMAVRTRLLLEAPITPTLLRLAAPTIVVMVLQAAINTVDAFYIGWLGPEALAGVSLVFPLLMLMLTMSAGGMGGGVASAIARALGAGRREDANALVVHALVIAVVMGAVFTTGFLSGGPSLYRVMGGTDGTLEAALAYSRVVFTGALAFWLFHTLSSIVRGTGNMLFPAGIFIAAGVMQVALAPILIVGWGPFPQLGVAGAGVAVVVAFTVGSLPLMGYLLSGRSLVKLSFREIQLRRALFWEILRVGGLGSLNNVLMNLAMALLAGLVGPFGAFALAGYGMGARLEYFQILLVFGFGSALVIMVGTNVGARQVARAERVAWVGAALAMAVTGSVGLLGALFPHLWIGIFSAEGEVLAAGATYLRFVGPTYGFFGLGLSLYFASQGAGRLLWPVIAGFFRLLIAGAGGWLAIHWLGGGLPAVFLAIALGLVIYGGTIAAALKGGAWR